MSTRPAMADDAAFLCAVYAATRVEELAQVPWTDQEKQAFCDQQFNAQAAYYRAHYPTAAYLVIEVESVPVGRLYVDRWEHEIRIMDISLLPEFRGRGTGAHLLRQLQDEAHEVAKSLTIHVEKFNPALRLYERMGFRAKEDKGVYLLMEWTASFAKEKR